MRATRCGLFQLGSVPLGDSKSDTILKIMSETNLKITNLKEFLEARNFGETSLGQAKRSTYKYTACGAWLAADPEGITVGSIVEGVDEGTQTHTLDYPFTIDQFWSALKCVEDEADTIWKETHGCENCGEEDPCTGYTPINDECVSCKGEGLII